MHNLYLPDLQRIERLCTRLHLLHPDNAVVQKLREMLVKHIRPLIALVKVESPFSERKPLLGSDIQADKHAQYAGSQAILACPFTENQYF